jgi:hypothetical protein
MAKRSLQVNVDDETFAGIEAEQRRLSALMSEPVSQSRAIASLLKRGLGLAAPVFTPAPPAVAMTPAPPAVAPVEPKTPSPPAVQPVLTAASVIAALDACGETQKALAERGRFSVGNFQRLRSGQFVSPEMLQKMMDAIRGR